MHVAAKLSEAWLRAYAVCVIRGVFVTPVGPSVLAFRIRIYDAVRQFDRLVSPTRCFRSSASKLVV